MKQEQKLEQNTEQNKLNTEHRQQPLIIGTNISLGYGDNLLVCDLYFSVYQGDYLAIVGHNGMGKSTFVRTLLGLQKPLKGTITFNNGLTSKDIGYLPQQMQIQRDFPSSVYEIVLSGFLGKAGLSPFYSKKQKQETVKNLEYMGIAHLRNRCFRELSGGQKQRVLLARALCSTSKLLLLDEPVAGLDPTATEDFYKLIYELNNAGITIIMVSHDVEAVQHFSTHILYLGNKPFFGTYYDFERSHIGQTFLHKEVV